MKRIIYYIAIVLKATTFTRRSLRSGNETRQEMIGCEKQCILLIDEEVRTLDKELIGKQDWILQSVSRNSILCPANQES
jgi:replication-associated recombination protein RarA